jgi:Flp pilus assembly protein protease CpaA
MRFAPTSLNLPGFLVIVLLLLLICLHDHFTMQVPLRLQALGFAVASFLSKNILSSAITSIILMAALCSLGFFYTRLRRQPSLGGGDILLLGWLTLIEGPDILLTLSCASLTGLVYLVIARRKLNSDCFPFCSFISFGFICAQLLSHF